LLFEDAAGRNTTNLLPNHRSPGKHIVAVTLCGVSEINRRKQTFFPKGNTCEHFTNAGSQVSDSLSRLV